MQGWGFSTISRILIVLQAFEHPHLFQHPNTYTLLSSILFLQCLSRLATWALWAAPFSQMSFPNSLSQIPSSVIQSSGVSAVQGLLKHWSEWKDSWTSGGVHCWDVSVKWVSTVYIVGWEICKTLQFLWIIMWKKQQQQKKEAPPPSRLQILCSGVGRLRK